MPQLILDEAAMRLAAQKLEGQAVHARPDGSFLDPGVVDLVDDKQAATAGWQPGDRRTRLLTLGAEACRDIAFHAEPVLLDGKQRRAIRAMVTPTCNLMDVTVQLLAELNDGDSRKMRESWLEQDQITYRETAKRLKKKHLYGPVRAARNKFTAHLDPDVYNDPVEVEIPDLLKVIGDSLLVLLLVLNHKSHGFAWIRGLGTAEDGKYNVVETMFSYPIAVRWLTDAEGHVVDVGLLQLATDPRHKLQSDFTEAVAVYNKLASLDGVAAPTIWIEMHSKPAEPPTEVKLGGPLR